MSQPHRNDDSLTPREFTRVWLSARAKTAAAGPVPDIGTTEFIRLSDADPRKLAAVCKAALGWLNYTDPAQIETDLLMELEALAANRREDLEREYRRTLRLLAGPSRAELTHRRRDIESMPISGRAE